MISHSRRGLPERRSDRGIDAAARLAAALLATMLAGCGTPPSAPPGGRPLLVSDRGGAMRVYEADDDAGSITLVGSADAADTAYADATPVRLADGRILLASTRSGTPALYVAASGGATARPLFPAAAGAAAGTAPADSDPAPAGADRILFARAPGAGAPRDLWIASIDGSGARALTRAPADDAAPCLLPDLRTVVFISDRGGAPRLHRLDLDAADPETTVAAIVAGADAIADAAPACLDDGSILFARAATGRPAQIMALAFGASPVLRQITEANVLPYGAGEPVAIGGGRFLLTAGPGVGPGGRPRYGIYRMATGGYNLTRVTRDGAGYSDFARGLGLVR